MLVVGKLVAVVDIVVDKLVAVVGIVVDKLVAVVGIVVDMQVVEVVRILVVGHLGLLVVAEILPV